MRDDWLDDDDSGSEWLFVAVVVLAVAAPIVFTLLGMPIMLMVPFVASGLLGWGLHWLLTVRLPETPLGFWRGYALDWFLGVWLLISFVAAYRHGAWAWLGHVATALGRPWEAAEARPDAVFTAIAVAFIGLQAIRLGEDAPWGEALAARVSPTFLHFGIKIGLLFGLVAFLNNGGEALVKRLFP
ncbi:MAG: hypothetical protein ACK46X_07030 [Candidatus Sericytochromatia bacterium]